MAKLKNLTPQAAAEFLAANPKAILLDIRTTIEHGFVGHPVDCLHIPWKDAPDWELNPNFVKEVLTAASNKDTVASRDVPLILMCRSGQRSVPASKQLMEAGFTNVMHIGEGFEGDIDEFDHRGELGGWRMRGLPWIQT